MRRELNFIDQDFEPIDTSHMFATDEKKKKLDKEKLLSK
jgi:hypothetical protein